MTKAEYAVGTVAILAGRTLLPYPDDLAPFGSVMQGKQGQISELLAWLSPQPNDDLPWSDERLGIVYVLTDRINGEDVPLQWPHTKINYLPESLLTMAGPQMQRPGFAAYFAFQILKQIEADASQLSEDWKPPLPN